MPKGSESENEQSNANKITFADFDKLNLKSFAENLFQIMEKGIASSIGERGAYTISLNAEFGNGKTTFLKMFEDFIKEKGQGYDVLFINAWESDFYKDLFIAVKSIPNGVVCLISALDIYDMTEEIPRVHWIAIPHATTAPKRSGVRFIRTRDIELGRTEIKIGREKIPIFDPERTIVDSFRYLSIEVAIKALKAGLEGRSGNRLDFIKLQTYAQKRKVNITPYVLTVTT